MADPRHPESWMGRPRRALGRIRKANRTGGVAEVASMVGAYTNWVVHGRPTGDADETTIDDWLSAYAELKPLVSSNGPLISVICPVYNTDAQVLVSAVESVLAQSYSRWELLLVDDGSDRSETLEVLERLANLDERVHLIVNSENAGIAEASNRGIGEAKGEYIVFLDHDDVLAPTALAWCAWCAPDADLVYSDEDKIDEYDEHSDPFFKPSWSPRLLLSVNYVGHLLCIRTALVREIDGLRPGFDGAQDHDLLLRLSERELAVAHVPAVLYHWRKSDDSTSSVAAAKPEAEVAGLKAVQEAIERRGWLARAGLGNGAPFNYRVLWSEITPLPTVKVVIPTRDRLELLERAVDGVLERTDGVRIQLVIVDNGSEEDETIAYLDSLRRDHTNVSVIRIDDAFNFSRLCNIGARTGPRADYVLLLNNDIEVRHRAWLQQLVGWLSDPTVVGVGPKLLFPDHTIQHGGVTLGMGGIAGHYASGQEDEPQLGNLHDQAREVGCLTAACLLVRTTDYEAVGGLNEDLPVDFQDVDFCLKLRTVLGGDLIYDPTYPLLHVQSASRGLERASSGYTLARLHFLWGEALEEGDPFFNPHFELDRSDFALASVEDLTREERMDRLRPRFSSTSTSNDRRQGVSLSEGGALTSQDPSDLTPVLVNGGGRNGTTLIMQLLGTSPEIVFERVYPFEQRYLTFFLRWVELIRGGVRPTEAWDQVAMASKQNDWIGPIPWVDPPLIQDVPGREEFSVEMFRSIWRAFSLRADWISTEEAGIAPGSTRYYAEKTPIWVREQLLPLMPIKVIHPLRDPRDTYLSVLAFHEKRGLRGFGREDGLAEEEYAERFAKGQRADFRRVIEVHESDQDIVVRYERLVDDLSYEAKRLGTWLGVDIDAQSVPTNAEKLANHVTSGSPRESVGRWKREMDPTLQKLFASTMGDEMEAAGYEV